MTGGVEFLLLRPAWLWLAALAPLVWWLLRPRTGDNAGWTRIVDPDLLAYLGFAPEGRRRARWAWVGALAWVLAAVGAAGPAFHKQPETLYRRADALVVLIDLSRSMLASDLQPSRLDQARYKLIDLLDRVREGQIGLVAYAGEPFIVSPLTSDANTVRNMVRALDPAIMPAGGSEADEALDLAAELLSRVGDGTGRILVMTDRLDASAVERVRSLAQRGIRVSVLGVGTPQGAPVPLPEGGVLTAADGRIVIPQLDEGALSRAAADGGGRYARITSGTQDLERLLDESWGGGDGALEQTDQDRARWRDEGPWLVLALLPLAALVFRRGVLLAVVLCFGPALDSPAAAAPLEGLFQTREQRAAAAMAASEYGRAASLSSDPLRQGNALYRAGEYAAAVSAYARAEGPEADYNQGNALARQGRYEEALAAYDRALGALPEFADARYNRDLVADLLEQQREQQGDEGEESDESRQQQDQGGEPRSGERQGEEQEQAQEGEEGDEPQQGDAQQAGEQQGAEPDGEQAQMLPSPEDLSAEEQQAMEQWLRRIPDDPGGLLRRKFLLEYQRRGSPPPRDAEDW